MAKSNISKFKRWLVKHGAVLQEETSEWEVVRFKTENEGVSIIYRNKKEHYKFTGEAEAAYRAFVGNRPWKSINRPRERLKSRKNALAQRDGHNCFGCWRKFTLDDLTIEHLLSFSHGGTDNDNNLCLLCTECQKILGNEAVATKFKLIIQQRLKYKSETVGPPKIIVESTPTGHNYFHEIYRKFKGEE